MKRLILSVAGVIIGFLGVSIALSQSVVSPTISGNEVIQVAQGPGGAGGLVTLDNISNRSSMQIASGSGAATSNAFGGTLMWIGTAPTTWAVTLPAAGTVPGGTTVQLTTNTTLTTMVTVTAGTGTTLNASYNSQTLTALTPVVFQYRHTDTTWYRTR